VIGLATADAGRMVRSYQKLNLLLPHADLRLLEQAEAAAFARFWGKSIEELRSIDLEEMHEFAKEFRDILYEMPYQVPQDLVFLFRCVAILSGMCTGLDPAFNFWDVLAPYAKKLMSDEAGGGILSEVGEFIKTLAALPNKTDRLLDKMNRGELRIAVPAAERRLIRIDQNLRRLLWAVLLLAFLSNGVALYLAGETLFSALLFALAGVSLIVILLSRR